MSWNGCGVEAFHDRAGHVPVGRQPLDSVGAQLRSHSTAGRASMASDVALLADHRDRTLPLKLPTIVPLRRLGGRMQPGAGDADSSAHPSSASSAPDPQHGSRGHGLQRAIGLDRAETVINDHHDIQAPPGAGNPSSYGCSCSPPPPRWPTTPACSSRTWPPTTPGPTSSWPAAPRSPGCPPAPADHLRPPLALDPGTPTGPWTRRPRPRSVKVSYPPATIGVITGHRAAKRSPTARS